MGAKKTYQITVYLYAAHDLDLITFKNIYSVNMAKAFYCCLKAFTRGEVFVIKMPEKREAFSHYNRRYRCKLRLDVDKDKAEIELLSKIARGFRNNFIKNLLRLYLRTPLTELFLNDSEDFSYFLDKFRIFSNGIRQADIASIKKEQEQQLKLGLNSPQPLNADRPESEIKAATKKAKEIVAKKGSMTTLETVTLPSGQIVLPEPQETVSKTVPSPITSPQVPASQIPTTQAESQIIQQTNEIAANQIKEETPVLAEVIMPEDVENLEELTEELSNAAELDSIFNDLF